MLDTAVDKTNINVEQMIACKIGLCIFLTIARCIPKTTKNTILWYKYNVNPLSFHICKTFHSGIVIRFIMRDREQIENILYNKNIVSGGNL